MTEEQKGRKPYVDKRTAEDRRLYRREYYQKRRDELIVAAKNHYIENKEKVLLYKKEYYNENMESIKIKKHERYENNKEKIQGYYIDNKEKILSQKRDYYYKNQEFLASQRRINRSKNIEKRMLIRVKYRAKRKNLSFDLTLEDIKIPEICPVLGMRLSRAPAAILDNTPSLDRIDNNLGYVKGNVIVVSSKANRIKSNATVDDLEKVTNFYRGLAVAKERLITDGNERISPACFT